MDPGLFESRATRTKLAARHGRVVATMKSATRIWLPPKRTPPAEWCAEHVWMPERSSAIRGRFNPGLFPYVRGPIDAFMDPGIEEIDLMWGSQLGKTAMLYALLAYVAIMDPAPALWAAPNETSCREFSKMRLIPGFESSPVLCGLLRPAHLRQAMLVDLGAMVLFFAWSGSVTRLGEKSVRYLFCTEIDKWDATTSTEADSLALATERTKAFPNAKRIFESTPSLAGTSRIDARYEASDRRRYHVPCPHCGAFQELTFESLHWPRNNKGRSCSPEEARRAAWYECVECNKHILDRHKPRMLAEGVWKAERKTEHIAGFHLSSLYSPLLTFGRIAEAWLRAHTSGHASERQNFINSWLGRTYSPPARETQRDEILAHRGMGSDLEYPPNECPITPALVIMTVDVQEDTFFYVIRAWAADSTSALIAYGEVATFNDLVKASMLQIKKTDGSGTVSTSHCFIDSGYRTKQVYRVCRDLSWNALKGHRQERMKAVHRSETAGVILWSISDPHFCEHLMYRIKEIDLGDPGAWRLHNETDTEYAKQLSSTRQTKRLDVYGNPKTVWLSTRANHYWDCEKYQEAAVSILGLDQHQTPTTPSQTEASPGEFDNWGDGLDLKGWQ